MNLATGENVQGERSEELQLVSFYLGGEENGIDILRVQEIIRMQAISRIPKAPEYVEGIINLRGKVIPIINLRMRFGLEKKENDKQTRIIVVKIEGKTLGLIVDSVSEVLRLPSDSIEPAPAIVTGKEGKYLTGVGKIEDKLIILLDLEKLLKDVEVEISDVIDPAATVNKTVHG